MKPDLSADNEHGTPGSRATKDEWRTSGEAGEREAGDPVVCTARELLVLQLAARGYQPWELERLLVITDAEELLRRAARRLGVDDIRQAVTEARRHRLIV